MKKIYGALSKIQQELKAPKNLYNKFGNYNYRNAEGILEAVKPLLGGLALIINAEPMMVGDRYYIKATATLTDGEEEVSATAYAREDETKKGMDGCQLTGACSSYARKYALNALLMIDDAKDSDDDALSPKNPENNKPVQKPAENANVSTAPAIPQKKNAKQFIKNELATMAEVFCLSPDEMMKKFIVMRKELIAKKIIPDIKSEDQTIEQARQMIDAIYQNYRPSGDAA